MRFRYVYNDGCSVVIYSKQKIVPKGRYDVTEDERKSPGVWDRRFKRNLKLSFADGEFSVSCKTTDGSILNPIDSEYISAVSGGLFILQ
jgi:hypothetical protein